jgi:hypothetical protein
MSHYTVTCHCERSEAIPEYLGDCFGAKPVLSEAEGTAPRNDKCDIVELLTHSVAAQEETGIIYTLSDQGKDQFL